MPEPRVGLVLESWWIDPPQVRPAGSTLILMTGMAWVFDLCRKVKLTALLYKIQDSSSAFIARMMLRIKLAYAFCCYN